MDISIRRIVGDDGTTIIPHGVDPVAGLRRAAEKGEQVKLIVEFRPDRPPIDDQARKIQKELIACSTTGVIKSLLVANYWYRNQQTTQSSFLH